MFKFEDIIPEVIGSVKNGKIIPKQPTMEEGNAIKLNNLKETFLSATPKPTLKSIISNIKDKIPLFESRMGGALRMDATKEYPYTDVAQEIINKKTFIKDTSPRYDEALGIGKQDHEIRDVSGNVLSKPSEITIGHPNLWYSGKTQPLTNSPTNKNKIDIRDDSPLTTGHELLHAISDQFGDFDPDEFNKVWEKKKSESGNKNSNYKIIDNIISGNNKLYNVDSNTLAKERFAYMGADVGRYGLDAFRPEFKPFYKSIFKGGSGGVSGGFSIEEIQPTIIR